MTLAKKLLPVSAVMFGTAALGASPTFGVTATPVPPPSCHGNATAPIPITNNPPPGLVVGGSPGVRASYDHTANKTRIAGTSGPDTVVGTNGDDFITTDGGTDSICARAGDDIVYGLADADWLAGGVGNDQVYGGAANDMIFGRAGNDMLYGGGGLDTIHGNSGNDFLFGDGGDDSLFGDTDNDTLDGDNGAAAPGQPPGTSDSCDGGSGTDSQADSRCESVTSIP